MATMIDSNGIRTLTQASQLVNRTQCPEISSNGVKPGQSSGESDVMVAGGPTPRRSMIGLAAGPGRGEVFGFRVAALVRDEIEFLLGLLQPQPDPLLVQNPEIASDGAVDQAQFVELGRKRTDP